MSRKPFSAIADICKTFAEAIAQAAGMLAFAGLVTGVGEIGYWLRFGRWPHLIVRTLIGDAPQLSWGGVAALVDWFLDSRLWLVGLCGGSAIFVVATVVASVQRVER